MGKTYKRYPRYIYRHPRGRKQALVAGARFGSIPPDSWDDIMHDDTCYLPWKISLALHKKGMSNEYIIRHVKNKFGCTQGAMENILYFVVKYAYWRGCDCEECSRARESQGYCDGY